MKLVCSRTNPPLGGIITAEYVKVQLKKPLNLSWGEESMFENVKCRTGNDVSRAIARSLCQDLYGSAALELTNVDHWLTFAIGSINSSEGFQKGLNILNASLGPVTYLANDKLSIADFAVFATLHFNPKWQQMLKDKSAPTNVQRWYIFMSSQNFIQNVLKSLPDDVKSTLSATNEKSSNGPKTRAKEGKFVDLPGAEMGKVVVRFPPEASGYLHIGHAKAALLNQYYQEAFEGKLIMRFDDTNPAKEDLHFEKVILEDVEMLEIKPDMFTHTSQYFDLMLEYCEKMLKDGTAYVDDTEAELMKTQREQRMESANRNNSVEKNLQMWEEMKKGSAKGQQCCVRAKIDMQSHNGCLRDPTIYRCKNEPHPKTGDKYKVYPTYDFACPIVDSIEGVTHTLRTMEYHDRDPQFYWFIDVLGLRKPYIWEYSRLSMTNTVLSKRKLTWFVNEGHVDGWDDPRMPTVRGVLRRGMTVEGLKEFIIAQGSSRSVVFMEWDKIWAFNKKVIDPIAARYMAVEFEDPVTVLVKGAKTECTQALKHPKDPTFGNKDVWLSPEVLIDRADADLLKEGENTTFIYWGNLVIKKINKKNNKIVNVEAEPNLENKDYKKTLKLTWLAKTPKVEFTPTQCVYFEHIISKPLLGKDEDFKDYIGHQTRREVQMLGDPGLKNLKKGDVIQLQRKGFFKVDVAYELANLSICKEQPIILFYIPDGTKDKTADTKVEAKAKSPAKAAAAPKGGETKTQAGGADLGAKVTAQGEKVRKLKAEKADKAAVTAEVQVLLALKAEFKQANGRDWTPADTGAPTQPTPAPQNTDLNAKIAAQGELVRKLKAEKADKAAVTAEVQVLLALKGEYKQATGKDWTPGATPAPAAAAAPQAKNGPSDLGAKITAQGDKVRKLKGEKADKAAVTAEVQALLALKAEFKKANGRDWTPADTGAPAATTAASVPAKSAGMEGELLEKIAALGDKIRKLKAEKASKEVVMAEVNVLKNLKDEYKKATGKEWTPQAAPVAVAKPAAQTANGAGDSAHAALTAKITEQGNLVRTLKSSNGSKADVEAAVKSLLDLKAEYKKATGTDFPVAGRTPSKPKEAKPAQQAKEKKPKPAAEKPEAEGAVKKQTRLGLEAKKSDNLPEWYTQVITKGEMIEYYDVSGCYILRPWSFAVWESIKEWLDAEVKKLGVQNCYFPMFVSKAALEKEKDHIADFSPEVAWVTKSGDSDMAEPIAVRPTSETVMYPSYAKWIQSYRDLPVRLNQWNNVVRWEFKHPQPFLRTREFLWQEGHTAFANKQEAVEEVATILDLYAKIYTDLLAIPVVKGRKTEKEKFAGGDYTLTAEAYISASGRAIQGATSHHLGQNFSKMFEIVFEDPETQEKKYVYQNSWGITTRTIGVMIMVHADDQGLVLPPRVASVQIVIVPCGITATLSPEGRKTLQKSCDDLEANLKKIGVKVKGDYRDNYSPGWKFNHWELKGVPIRVELGPKDIEKKQLVAVRRDTGEKITINRENAVEQLASLLEQIHKDMYQKACNELDAHKIVLTEWSKFTALLDQKNLLLVPFCGDKDCEEKIKADSARDDDADSAAPSMGAKSLCIPLEQPTAIKPTDKCIHPACTRKPKAYTLFGRSY
ncbi:unnamed protein product [Brassicogethes aeneus]|uniref:Bifunctional glutamate/proline--tRNA ligase n=1 Tax=Brassicogethes aeneus TaxID=1431903 RepID=A0A9P0FFL5_BRAAE|nr:unnamed protein product [Brassicogethes aeneus]